jgi:hypothetical protein
MEVTPLSAEQPERKAIKTAAAPARETVLAGLKGLRKIIF